MRDVSGVKSSIVKNKGEGTGTATPPSLQRMQRCRGAACPRRVCVARSSLARGRACGEELNCLASRGSAQLCLGRDAIHYHESSQVGVGYGGETLRETL